MRRGKAWRRRREWGLMHWVEGMAEDEGNARGWRKWERDSIGDSETGGLVSVNGMA